MSYDELNADRSLTTDPGDPVLPPVQPPSAGFLVQLFVVPALIVLAQNQTSWENLYLTALAQAGLLRPVDMPPAAQ